MPKPTGRNYRLISADSHVVETPDLWEKWLDAKYRDRAPHIRAIDEAGIARQVRRKDQR